VTTKRDFYEVLGVPREATDAQIKSAYRKLALKYHPDRNQGDENAEERFKEAAEAYAVLADDQKRAAYDRFGHSAVSGAAGAQGFDPSVFSGFEDILGNIFGFGEGFGGRRRSGAQRGSDLRYDLEISFEEAARGTETTIQVPRLETCENCRGSGAAPGSAPITCPQCRGVGQVRRQQGFFTIAHTCGQCRGTGRVIEKPCSTCRGATQVEHDRKLTVKIPAGIATGQRLRLYGEGEHGPGGGPPGDLYVVIGVQEHPFFRREGNHLLCEVPVSYPTLTLGGEITVPTLDGTERLKIPEGTAAGSTFRLRTKGLPDVSGRGRGDLYVNIQVDVPKKLNKEQKTLLRQLAKALPAEDFEPKPQDDHEDRNLFDRVKDIFG
jgi:molecular chaperone DnaJ